MMNAALSDPARNIIERPEQYKAAREAIRSIGQGALGSIGVYDRYEPPPPPEELVRLQGSNAAPLPLTPEDQAAAGDRRANLSELHGRLRVAMPTPRPPAEESSGFLLGGSGWLNAPDFHGDDAARRNDEAALGQEEPGPAHPAIARLTVGRDASIARVGDRIEGRGHHVSFDARAETILRYFELRRVSRTEGGDSSSR